MDTLDNQRLPDYPIIVECGSGSGIVSGHMAATFQTAQVISTDLNPYANEATADTLRNTLNRRPQSTVARMSLLTNFKNESVDAIVFNPPYVPSEPGEIRDELDYAWAGGRDGTESTHPLVADARRVLRVGGSLYLLLEKRNNPEHFVSQYRHDFGRVDKIGEKKIPGELLSVWRFVKT
ncbi:methyltransferase domain protein [Gregarina niphandrodes]|uniref:Methyltransferase domain protein n=1 Tax=Gregarina niphandrodes TaxID=110365 RepID=A0A023BCK2_GRENI|nr:methyltransferase domain protein [Gregarina niphandrodes]EZG83582.1 methyltransferase domain protein [Gregarina niphandrodes]|eukprot:XP_011128943.1 methyltransferase domain protein [Gregarina niphandrodes]